MIVDIDGTLVDSNYHHTIAWSRAFRELGIDAPLWHIHRRVGMGGDQLVPAVAGSEVAGRLGEALRDAEAARFRDLIGEVRPLPGARRLLEALRDSGHRPVLASSAKQDEVDHYLDLLDARGLVEAWTSDADVDRTKPQPDLVHAAMDKVADAQRFVMIGDTTWDALAAARARVPAIGLLSGGFGEDELRAAGCRAVFADAGELAGHLTVALAGSREPLLVPAGAV